MSTDPQTATSQVLAPEHEPEPGPGLEPPASLTSRPLSRREARWVLRRCAKQGHLVAHLDDAQLAERFGADSATGPLLRCLRCGDFTSAADPQTRGATVLGSPSAPAPLADIPQALRGGHGRKLALLRVLAVERGARGLLMLVAAAGIARLASSRVAVADWLGQVAKAAQPLAEQLGWDISNSATLHHTQDLLGHSGHTFLTVAWLLGGYGALQIVEGVGLWGGWLWAEYLAAVATSAFVPLEGYELLERVTVFKALALLVNVAAVVYLVYKGRLFGIRGGHRAYLAEVRDGTLLAEELRLLERPTEVLTGHALV